MGLKTIAVTPVVCALALLLGVPEAGAAAIVTAASDASRPRQTFLIKLMVDFPDGECPNRPGSLRPIAIALSIRRNTWRMIRFRHRR